jgi:glycosyltransferase involved in cell wall biosynthesis
MHCAEASISRIPAIAVVIPTYRRPELVLRAVSSALSQTWRDLEVVAIVDGRDQATEDSLATVGDRRLSIHVPDRRLGQADARNFGTAMTAAPWVAFLDDDDEWMPEKLERQMQIALRMNCPHPIVSCRVLARRGTARMVWPRRVPRSGEEMSEYLYCRRTPFTGEGMIPTSSILTTRELMREVPFSGGLARHVDVDWVLRATRRAGTRVEFVSDREPLVVWDRNDDRVRIGTTRNWEISLAWCRANRSLFTKRGYAAFLVHSVGASAAKTRAWRAFPILLGEAVRYGRPAAIDLASHVANFCVPVRVQRLIAAGYARAITK